MRGVKTLGVRMERHNGSAMALAEYLSGHAAVRRVHYPFLPQHPQHALAKAQMRGGSGIISFELDADAAGAARFIESLRVFSLAGSLGGVESLATIPAATTHARLSASEREAMGISDGLIRLSVGIEAVEDLIGDIDHALIRHATTRGSARGGGGTGTPIGLSSRQSGTMSSRDLDGGAMTLSEAAAKAGGQP
jgi:cystathionine gamma-lyase